MNIDRPLDDLVKEARNKSAEKPSRKAARRANVKKNTGAATATPAGTAPGAANVGTPRGTPGQGGKRRRGGKGRGGGKKMSDDGKPGATASVTPAERKIGVAIKDRPSMKKKKRAGVASKGGMEVDRQGAKEIRKELNKAKPNAAGPRSNGTKITVSNLAPAVTIDDLRELFGGIGPIRNAIIIAGGTKQSPAQAEVMYTQQQHALEAISKYNNVPLDGLPLKISLATGSLGSGRLSQPRNTDRGGAGKQKGGAMDVDRLNIGIKTKDGKKVITARHKPNRRNRPAGGAGATGRNGNMAD